MKKHIFVFLAPFILAGFLLSCIIAIFEKEKNNSEVVRYEMPKQIERKSISLMSADIANMTDREKDEFILRVCGVNDPDDMNFAQSEIEKNKIAKKGAELLIRKRLASLGINIKNEIKFRPVIKRAADAYDINPRLLRAIAGVESKFDPYAISKKGARGLFQLMPLTASEMGVKKIFDPHQNIKGGAKYFARLLRYFEGNERKALAAYNFGLRRVRERPQLVYRSRYVNKVLFVAYGLQS